MENNTNNKHKPHPPFSEGSNSRDGSINGSNWQESNRELPLEPSKNRDRSRDAKNIYFPTVKEVIQLTNGVLYPPNPNAPGPTTRRKPLGCKTVFVGGLPEKITEEIIKEIFERCGNVETVRMSKKNFCHIRFSNVIYVENAIYFSGYRLKIENKDEVAFTGRLHVDYAQARDDQYDYECKQRSPQCQQLHQSQEYFRSVTPPVVHYTDHEASLICKKLNSEKTFSQAACILVSWLEGGECSEKNAGLFYSMIQSMHNHIQKLQVDKAKHEEQLNEAKKMRKKQLKGIIRQYREIGKIYKAASFQKCWDLEKLKSDEAFWEAADVLVLCLERGECSEKNAGLFYSMIQSMHNHVQKLQVDKAKHEEQLNEAKKMLKGIIRQYRDIGKIYKAASLQKCWDLEKLKSDEAFSQAANVLKLCLERGECSEKNAGLFYSMIQSMHNHIRKLQVQKVKHEEQLTEAKKQLEGIIPQYRDIGNIYKAASLQKCWDLEKLKSDEAFSQVANVLMLCLERGECSEKNAGSFYSMIQSMHNHIQKLQVDEAKHEEQLTEAKKQLEGIIREYRDIDKIYNAASLQKCWDHLKNIEIWRKQTEELRNTRLEKVINGREDREMELSENEESKTTVDVEQMKNKLKEEWRKLQEQRDSLNRRLEASQKEIMVLQADQEKEIKEKDDELEKMQEELHKSKKDVLNLTNKRCKDEAELKELRALKIKRDEEVDEDDSACDSSDAGSGASASSSSALVECEAHLISLLSVFLNVHAFGASIAYIGSYLHQIDTSIEVRDVENLMRRFPRLFRESSKGVGASLCKLWHFNGFTK